MCLSAIAFALGAALFFGVSAHLQRLGLDHISERRGTMISVAAMAAVLWIVAPFVIEWHWWTSEAVWVFAACGLVFPAFSQSLQVMSVPRVGPALTAAIGSFYPVFAILPALAFLGETFSFRAGSGLALMIAALFFSAISTRGAVRAFPLIALAFPLGAAFFRGIVQPASKIGLESLPSPFFAALVMTSVSVAVVAVISLFRTSDGPVRRGRPGDLWFVATGAVVAMGILTMQFALASGPVTVVAPLLATVPLWTLLTGWLIFRREALGMKHALTAILVTIGAALIVAG